MKKFIFMLLLLLPLGVYAKENPYGLYNAKVTNKNGITYRKYDTEKAMSEEKIAKKGADLIVVIDSDDEYYYAYYDDETFAVKPKDISISTDSFKCETCLDSKTYSIAYQDIERDVNKLTSFVKQNIEIKKGPGANYESTGIIMESINDADIIYYFNECDPEECIPTWAYIKYDNNYGWVNLYMNKDIYFELDSIYLTTEKINITLDGNVVGSIPANTEISPNYYNQFKNDYYITYNGKSGFIKHDKLAYQYVDDIIIRYEHPLLKEANKNSTVLTTVPAETQITQKFYFLNKDNSSCIYTTYKNNKGWICLDKGEGVDYVRHNYKPNPLFTTTTRKPSTTRTITNNLVSSSDLVILLTGVGAIILAFVLFIVIKSIRDKKVEKQIDENKIEEISKIEEDLDE